MAWSFPKEKLDKIKLNNHTSSVQDGTHKKKKVQGKATINCQTLKLLKPLTVHSAREEGEK